MPFSEQAADRACNFFENVLKHTADEWYGKPFILCPWQREAIRAIFGGLRDDGGRQVELAYLEVPKKSGKSEMTAGLVLFVLAVGSLPGNQVYGVASSQRQAGNVFRAACKMVEQSPVLSKLLLLRRGTNRIVKRNDPESFYAAIAADGDLTDGVNPAFTVADEVHRWKTRKQLENWDVLANGGITRKQTLTVAITTAGIQSESPLAWRLHEKTLRIQKGLAQDPSFYGRIYAADRKDDWTAESTWIKANPSLKENGGFLDLSKIREKYKSCLSEPGGQSAFRRYFENLWDEKEDHAIDLAKWDACTSNWQAAPLQPRREGSTVRALDHGIEAYLLGRPCYAGIDLSTRLDLSAVSLVFPSGDDGYDVVPFIYLPEKAIRKLELQTGMPIARWVREGWLEAHPGEMIDYTEIKARLNWAKELFDLRECCFDPWNSREISTQCEREGYTCVEVRQGFQSLNEPTKRLLEMVACGKLHHGNHPVLRWHASCLAVKEVNDNIMPAKPERATDSNRIDAISATVDALHRAIVAEPEFTGPLAWG